MSNDNDKLRRPVTDAEVELDALLAAMPDSVVYYDGFHVTDAWIERLRALIARRVQQATAAAEELARAVDAAVSVVEYHAGRFGEPPTECVRLSRKRFDAMREALAAFRAAQGGGK